MSDVIEQTELTQLHIDVVTLIEGISQPVVSQNIDIDNVSMSAQSKY
jgi:hypothetical protein